MDTLLGSIRRVADDFSILDTISLPTLAEQLETVKKELAEFEVWLGCPPADATEAAIQEKLSLWDTCRQWLLAYENALTAKQREIASLDEELAVVRVQMRDLEAEHFQSHSDMAGGDAYWDELDRRENRILARLQELGAPQSAHDEPPAPVRAAAPPPNESALDREWRMANFAGPGCPFCDAIIGCGCWERRTEERAAEERRRVRQDRATIAARIARGECTCDQLSQYSDYNELCDVCQHEEELRCRECGQLECRPECCGGCGGCSRCRGDPCKRCGDWDCCCYEEDYRREVRRGYNSGSSYNSDY